MTHRNITSTPTRYPAPAHWYGEGKYYVEAEADHADKRVAERRANQTPTSPTYATPVKSYRPSVCPECGSQFTRNSGRQITCSRMCGSKRKFRMQRVERACA